MRVHAEFLGIRLGAPLNEAARVIGKLDGALHDVANWVGLVLGVLCFISNRR